MRFKKFTWILHKNWRNYLVIVGIAIVSVIVLFSQLNSLNAGSTSYENAAVNRLKTNVISIKEPLNTPYFVIAKVLTIINDNPLHVLRFTSVLIGLVSVAAFYLLLFSMFDERISAVGTLLYLSSSWFLHSTRVAGSMSLSIASFIILLAIASHLNTILKYKRLVVPLVPIIGVCLYAPGSPIILLTTLLFYPVKTYRIQKELSIIWRIVVIASIGLILAPLVFMLVAQPINIIRWFGLPTDFVNFGGFLRNIILVPLSVFYRSQPDAAIHLARLPMLDIFSSVLFALGVYAILSNVREKFNQLLIVTFFVLGVIVASYDNINLGLHWLIPYVYIVIIFGFVELLGQWVSVFPRNPVARGIGIGLLVISVGFISSYHLNRYYMAWPSTPETKKVYSLKQ